MLRIKKHTIKDSRWYWCSNSNITEDEATKLIDTLKELTQREEIK